MIEINKCKLVPGITSNWGDILGDITKQQDLVDYVASHGGGVAAWGSITGDIADQSDLTDYVSTALSGYATEDWVTAQSYLVESDLSQYATRQWVTSRNYATETYVDEKTVQYDKTIEIGDSDIEDSVDVLKREVDEDGLTKQLVLGYKVIDDGVYDTIVVNDGFGSGELRLGRQEMTVEVDSELGERIIKGEFHPYYEIADGLPVTSEENEMTDLAGDLKYIPFDKDDCSRILVGLNTSENSWTGLMVNDEGQAGLYTSSVETDAETQETVLVDEFYPYLIEDNLKTVNGESIVGSGNIEVSGLTPEQEEAIEPLMNPEGGMLYTNTVKVNGYKDCQSPFNNEYRLYIYDVDGDILYYQYGNMYKWNPEKFEWEYVTYFSGAYNYSPLWKDDSGRMYEGVYCQLDETTDQVLDVNLNCNGYGYSLNHHTIWKGKYGIYHLKSAQKFNENTQMFEPYTINITQGYDLSVVGEYMAKYGFEYEGNMVCVYPGGEFWSMTEYEDRVDINLLSEPLFPLEVNGNTLEVDYFVQTNYGLLYVYGSNCYKLVDGAWVDFPIYYENGDRFINFRYENCGIFDGNSYLLGMTSNEANTKTTLINISGDYVESTYWTKPSNVGVVDLKSYQIVEGSKEFSSLITNSFGVTQMYSRNGETTFNLGKNTTQAASIKFTVPGVFTLNDKNIATTDKCILNREEVPYGSRTVNVVSEYDHQYSYNYWTTNTGRLFRYFNGVYEEFDGTQWNQVNSISISMDWPRDNVKQTSNDTFYNYNGNTYIWDDANTDWVLVAQNSPGSDRWLLWPCGDTLRWGDEWKLVKTGSTYSWEQDVLSVYHRGMTYVVNGNVYVLTLDDNYVYQYDENTKTYTQLGTRSTWTQESFSCFGEIFFPFNGDNIRRIDFSSIDPNDSNKQIDVVTSIPYSSYDYFYGGYDGHVWLWFDYHTFGYCYDIEENSVEVPSTDGTYVLKATVLNGEVTYYWDVEAPL